MVQLFIGYCFPRMLMPCSIMFNFCLLMRKAKIFCGFAHTLLHSLYIYEIYLLNIYVLNYFFISIKKPVVDSLYHLLQQADKEFVWSLWKRLQVANPDLTQAVSLVVERWVDYILLPEKLSHRKLFYHISAKEYVWKWFKGCLGHPGHSSGGYHKILCRCCFKSSYPRSSGSTIEVLLMEKKKKSSSTSFILGNLSTSVKTFQRLCINSLAFYVKIKKLNVSTVHIFGWSIQG